MYIFFFFFRFLHNKENYYLIKFELVLCCITLIPNTLTRLSNALKVFRNCLYTEADKLRHRIYSY